MISEMPAGLSPYKRTPEFAAATTPAGLLRDHSTAAGVWGRIVVLAGNVEYEISGTGEIAFLDATTPGFIEPQVTHRVTPSDDARFYVEFWR